MFEMFDVDLVGKYFARTVPKIQRLYRVNNSMSLLESALTAFPNSIITQAACAELDISVK